MQPLRFVVFLTLVFEAGCGSSSAVRSRVTLVSRSRASLEGEECAVRRFTTTLPPYRYVDLATLQVRCPAQAIAGPRGESSCLDRMLADACSIGADTAYNIRQSSAAGDIVLTARLAAAIGSTEASPELVCEPICSPGFACDRGRCVPVCEPACESGTRCEAGHCVAQCNPPCAEGFTCAEDRTCQAIPAPPPAVDAGPADAEPPSRRRRGKRH